MNSKVERMGQSRAKISITAEVKDLTHALDHALAHTTAHVAIRGFRPGKAPKAMLVAAVSKGRILSELVDHALPELLMAVADKEKIAFIATPKYALEKLCELNDDGSLKDGTTLEFSADADYAPNVTVGDYAKIKVTPAKIKAVTDKEIDTVLGQLADRRATFTTVDRPAAKGDKVEIDFIGKRNGIPEDRLTSKNHPLTLGQNTMIPGFEDKLIGKSAGESLTFELTFPKDYRVEDLRIEKVIFEVKVHSVAQKVLPELNDAFAAEFGHKKLDDLKAAIRQEREMTYAEEAKEADQVAVLDKFLPLVKVDVPQSLVERELDRQVDVLRKQAEGYGMTFDRYLEHIKKTEEAVRTEMRPSAAKAVAIGLGLGEVVVREKIGDSENAGFVAIEKLVEIATQASQSKK